LPAILSLIVFVAASVAAPLPATPVNPQTAIENAVRVAGATDARHARSRQFLQGFAAVLTAVKPREVAEYVATAIKMRSDLTGQLVVVALQMRAKDDDGYAYSESAVREIVTAAVAANPKAAPAIVRAAILLNSKLRSFVVAAAISAAPAEKVAILRAANTGPAFAFLTASYSDDDSGFSSWSGALDHANIDVGGSSATISPEQPPSR
jgi:hypothetical protein